MLLKGDQYDVKPLDVAGKSIRYVGPAGPNGGGGVAQLSLYGPPVVQVGVASAPFVVAAVGVIGAAGVVCTFASTIPGTFTPAFVTLTEAAPIATATFTASAAAAAGSVTAVNSLGFAGPTPLGVAATLAAVPAVSIPNKWIRETNPALPFEVGLADARGLAPAGVNATFANLPQKTRANVTALQLAFSKVYNTWLDLTNTTATEVQYGNVTPTYPFITRVADPDNGAKWAFKHQVNKTEFGWVGPPSSIKKMRAEMFNLVGGSVPVVRFGTPKWCAWAVRFPDYWRTIDSTLVSQWAIMSQFQGGPTNLTGNPDFCLRFEGGGATPANARFRCWLRYYDHALWPDLAAPKFASELCQEVLTVPVAADTWHWFVADYNKVWRPSDATKWQFCTDAEHGALNPGPWFRLYHAVGNGPLYLAMSHNGYWAGPEPYGTISKQGEGTWRTGFYGEQQFDGSETNNRQNWTKGIRQYLQADVPGATAADILADFRTA